MTCGAVHVVAVSSALALASVSGVRAQQAGAGQIPATTPQATKPVPIERPSQGGREQSRLPQGFSVVLVVADLQASSAQDDVPPAARRALNDMKEFLPYKSYKLVDAAWILGQGTGGTSTRLRGPEEQDYELNLHTNRSEGSRVSVRFTLKDPMSAETTSENVVVQRNREAQMMERELAQLQERLREARERNQAEQVKDLTARIDSINRRRRAMAETARAETTTQSKYTPRASRTIIDTSFTMDVGETVVVGTSRLKANSKALIALLTAVPPKSSRPIETR